jgi:hypothetical protein
VPSLKTCTKCKEIKELERFNADKRNKDGKRSYCKCCQKNYHKTRKKKTKSGYSRDRHYKRTYGITLEQYQSMFYEQNGKCAICKKSSDKRLVVDHSHETGKVRGLLCSNCNTALGLLKEKEENFLQAILYLKQH